MPLELTIATAVAGLIFSSFYAFGAFDALGAKKPEKWLPYLHQLWFNFVGSAIGWCAVWLIIYKLHGCVQLSCPATLDLSDFLLLLVAFAGVTGHIPMATHGFFISLGDTAKQLWDRWRKPSN